MPIFKFSIYRLALSLALLAVLTGCKEESIRTYRAAKDPAPQLPMAPVSEATPSVLPQWKQPDGWVPQPASAMRLASFRAGAADVSVSKMPGTAGGTLANVNRWRGQVGLAPFTEEQLASEEKSVEVGGEKALLFEMVGDKAPEGKSQAQGTIAAIVPHSGEMWFFKMSGDAAAVADERARFTAFLQSIRFE